MKYFLALKWMYIHFSAKKSTGEDKIRNIFENGHENRSQNCLKNRTCKLALTNKHIFVSAF